MNLNPYYEQEHFGFTSKQSIISANSGYNSLYMYLWVYACSLFVLFPQPESYTTPDSESKVWKHCFLVSYKIPVLFETLPADLHTHQRNSSDP